MEVLRPDVEAALGGPLGDPVRVRTITREEYVAEILNTRRPCEFFGLSDASEVRFPDEIDGVSGEQLDQLMGLVMCHQMVHVWQDRNEIPNRPIGSESGEVGDFRHALREGHALLVTRRFRARVGYSVSWNLDATVDEEGRAHRFRVAELALTHAMAKGGSQAEAVKRFLETPPLPELTEEALRAYVDRLGASETGRAGEAETERQPAAPERE